MKSHEISQCEQMCPEEEVQKRINESDVHKLELSDNLRATMIKKFQRSSAGIGTIQQIFFTLL